MRQVDSEPILVTGAAGQLGSVGRTVTGLLLDRGLAVRAMVRREDDRAAALRAAGAEVVIGTCSNRPMSIESSAVVASLLRDVRVGGLPEGDRDYGGGRTGTRGERIGQQRTVADS